MVQIDTISNKFNYSNSVVIDLTTRDVTYIYAKLSPYYPHGNIPIPNTPKEVFRSVNEVWQKLCIKDSKSEPRKLKIKKGLHINEYWSYAEARKKILIPLYSWMLENNAWDIINDLRELSKNSTVTIIDKSVNCNIDNINEPLSFAFLLKAYIEGTHPYEEAIKEVVENRIVMKGRKHICIKKKKFVYQKIAHIYTEAQRILDM